jgi:hypothetical protein
MDDTVFGDLNNLDILAKRKDGGVDLIIIAVGKVPGDPEIQEMLLTKVRNYLGFINSDDFSYQFGLPDKAKVRIILQCEVPPDKIIYEFGERIKPWAEENNASFLIAVGKDSY